MTDIGDGVTEIVYPDAEAEIERLRRINADLVNSKNALLIENVRLRERLDTFLPPEDRFYPREFDQS